MSEASYNLSKLTDKAKTAFRNQFKEAREYAISDAEGFQEILYSLERLGSLLKPEAKSLHQYKDAIKAVATKSPLYADIPDSYRYLHTPFEELYKMVTHGRNDAMHQGAYARHLTTHAVELSLILEDALSNTTDYKKKLVADYMVKGVSYAELWQPISFIRQIMLANSFSFLPVFCDDCQHIDGTSLAKDWHLISDTSIAKALIQDSKGVRDKILATTLHKAIEDNTIIPIQAKKIQHNEIFGNIIDNLTQEPLLVLDGTRMVGIIAPFDIL